MVKHVRERGFTVGAEIRCLSKETQMPVLTPPDRGDRDEITTTWLTPPPSATWSERLLDALENPRNRALAVLVGLAILLLVAVAAIGGDDEATVAAPPQSILTGGADGDAPRSGGVGLGDDSTADQATPEEQGTGQEPELAPIDQDPVSVDPADIGSADADPATEPAEPDPTPAEEEPPTGQDPPPAVEDEQPADPTTTAAPTTEAPTTEAPTTAPPTTPTTATPTTATPTTAAPTTAAPTAPPAPSGSGVQGQVLSLTNAERAKVGCPALALDGRLNAASTAHSQDMAANSYFSHTGLNGSQPWDRSAAAGYPVSGIAENIAQGYGSPEAVVTGWMNSPGHRANIVNCSYRHMGLGHVASGNYWTQMFGAG